MPDPRDWKDLPLVTQAAIRCQDPTFWRFLAAHPDHDGGAIQHKGHAAMAVRSLCGVVSRAHLATNEDAAAAWRKLDADFERWNKS
jgi:hypothetical protein